MISRVVDMNPVWKTPVGWSGSREEIKAMYGGSTGQGMETPRESPNVLLFTDPKVGVENGYEFDGWSSDGTVFSYTGMGRTGPQKWQKGNLYTRDHKSLGRSLRLFAVDGKIAGSGALKRVYLGEFELDSANPYSIEDGIGTDGVMRTVFVFHLRPVGDVLRRDQDVSPKNAKPSSAASATEVPLEDHKTKTFVQTSGEAVIAEKREQELVAAFQSVLESRGSKVNRFKILPPGSTSPLFTDIHDATNGVLYEAKADATRGSVRGGLGQLLDYRRYVNGKHCRLLLPAKPADDLLELLGEHGIAVLWRDTENGPFHIHDGGATRLF